MRPIRTCVLSGRVSVLQSILDSIIGVQFTEIFEKKRVSGKLMITTRRTFATTLRRQQLGFLYFMLGILILGPGTGISF